MARRNGAPGYGLGKFILDAIATVCTAGFWLIWVFIREMRYMSAGGRR